MTMRIKDFKKVFWLKDVEAHRDVSWCKYPVTRRSVRFRTLMSTAAGREAYIIFLAVVSIVARERTGGALTMNGRDMTPEDVAAELGTPKRDITRYWNILIDIGWIEKCPSSTGFEPVENRSQTVFQPVSNRSETAPIVEKRKEQNPPLYTPPGNSPKPSPQTADAIGEAVRMCDRWASASRKRGLDAARGEPQQLGERLSGELAEAAPVPHGGALVPAVTLAAQAAEALRVRGTPFKGVSYAVACVVGQIDEWRAGTGDGEKRKNKLVDIDAWLDGDAR